MISTSQQTLNFKNSPLVRQVIFIAFMATCGVFAVFSAFQAYSTYSEGQIEIVKQVNNLERTVENQLESSLWGMDKESVSQILKVVVSNPNISAARIVSSDLPLTEIKAGNTDNWITLDYPLIHFNQSNKQKDLGVLKLTLTKSKFLRDLEINLIYSLMQNFVRFIVISFCIVWLINKKIIDPVRKIQLMTKQFNEDHLSPILGTKMTTNVDSTKSELDSLHNDIHLLQENFKKAFELQKKSEEARFEADMQLEKERQKLMLAQRLETIGQITAQVAHDFANLIMIINGKTKALDNRLTDEADLRHTEAIRKATTKASRLIKKILSMTRLQKAEPVLFDPFQSIIDMQDLLKISIGAEILLNVETDGASGMIHVEPSSFENVIINLCVNARDAMPAGGKIGIEVKNVIKNYQDFVSISVRDTGTGIPEEIQMKIFDPFFTTKGVGKGTGLGLSQVQDFVKNVGGSLELSSCSEGTCFTLYLPNKCQVAAAA